MKKIDITPENIRALPADSVVILVEDGGKGTIDTVLVKWDENGSGAWHALSDPHALTDQEVLQFAEEHNGTHAWIVVYEPSDEQ